MMSRYHRVSPDVLPLSNGRKPILRTWKEDADRVGRNPNNHSLHESKSVRARSVFGTADPYPTREHPLPGSSYPSHSPTSAENQSLASACASASPTSAHEISNGAVGPCGDVILRWGSKKRSRGPRAECRASGDEVAAHLRRMPKIQRRSSSAATAAAAAAAMPPPSYGGSRANQRTSLPARDAAAQVIHRGAEDRSGGPPRSEKRSPSSLPEKPHRNGFPDEPMNIPDPKQTLDQETGATAPAVVVGEKLCLDQFDWPKICVSLSRKEKEDDFLAMKGTKLPQRPKKRAKNIDKTLQYCFPGMWLSDLTRGRYEVREKKCVKKKRRGLKGMDSLDSDSD